MTLRTIKSVAITYPDRAAAGPMAQQIVIPVGTEVLHVAGNGGGYAVNDTELLVKLTGNDHDPKYRYAWLPADVIADDAPGVPTPALTLSGEAGTPTSGHFAVEAGRSITRDGKPFVLIARNERGNYVSPTDADEFARRAVACVNALAGMPLDEIAGCAAEPDQRVRLGMLAHLVGWKAKL